MNIWDAQLKNTSFHLLLQLVYQYVCFHMLVSLAKACKNSIKNSVMGKKILNAISRYYIENLSNIDTINSRNIYNYYYFQRLYKIQKNQYAYRMYEKYIYIKSVRVFCFSSDIMKVFHRCVGQGTQNSLKEDIKLVYKALGM